MLISVATVVSSGFLPFPPEIRYLLFVLCDLQLYSLYTATNMMVTVKRQQVRLPSRDPHRENARELKENREKE